jgi:type IV pilus assembly protein PilF
MRQTSRLEAAHAVLRCTGVRILVATLVLAGCVTTTNFDPKPPEDPAEAAQINTQLGAEYLKQGKLDLAREKLEKAIEQDPQLPSAHTYLALVYDELGDTDKAEKHYERALRLEPGVATTLNLYGAFLCRHDREKDAERYFEEAAKDKRYKTPEVPLTNAGVCLLRVPDVKAAESYFRQALELNPKFQDALWQMSRLSFEGSNYLQARAFLQRFAEVGTMNAQALWLGVRVERSLGDTAAADRYAQRLKQEFPSSDEARLLAESKG